MMWRLSGRQMDVFRSFEAFEETGLVLQRPQSM